MTNLSNYGVILSLGSVSGSVVTYSAIAGLNKMDFPKLKNPEINVTNHGSQGYVERVTSGLIEVEPFKGTFSFSASGLDLLVSACTSGSVSKYKITFPNTKAWAFDALVTEFQPSGADAQSPEQLLAEITFAPTGVMTIS